MLYGVIIIYAKLCKLVIFFCVLARTLIEVNNNSNEFIFHSFGQICNSVSAFNYILCFKDIEKYSVIFGVFRVCYISCMVYVIFRAYETRFKCLSGFSVPRSSKKVGSLPQNLKVLRISLKDSYAVRVNKGRPCQ